jgi:hypothetical protein
VLFEILADDTPDPHPELVASIRPTPAEMMRAVAVIGWTPPGDGYLAPLR